MAQVGADVEALEGLARRFGQEASKLDEIIGSISSQVQATWWQGQDAESFRSLWQGELQNALRTVKQKLTDQSTALTRQATSQREASQA